MVLNPDSINGGSDNSGVDKDGGRVGTQTDVFPQERKQFARPDSGGNQEVRYLMKFLCAACRRLLGESLCWAT